MLWKNMDLSKFKIAAAPFGGPVGEIFSFFLFHFHFFPQPVLWNGSNDPWREQDRACSEAVHKAADITVHVIREADGDHPVGQGQDRGNGVDRLGTACLRARWRHRSHLLHPWRIHPIFSWPGALKLIHLSNSLLSFIINFFFHHFFSSFRFDFAGGKGARRWGLSHLGEWAGCADGQLFVLCRHELWRAIPQAAGRPASERAASQLACGWAAIHLQQDGGGPCGHPRDRSHCRRLWCSGPGAFLLLFVLFQSLDS